MESNGNVRAALLVGSRGQSDSHPDSLSDYDLLLFVQDPSRWETEDDWLTELGAILVRLDDEYELLGTRVPTRLVQYRSGSKVDFSICAADLLKRISSRSRLPDPLDAGFRVLTDKDEWTSRLPAPGGEAFQREAPSEHAYREVVNEFWWEVLYVAKHLARGEIFPALYSHECVVRFRCLVPMLEWYAHAVRGSEVEFGPHGRGLVPALEPEEVGRVHRTILGSSIEEAWRALLETTGLFQEVSTRVATQLGFTEDDGLAEDVEGRLRDIRRSQVDDVE